MSSDLHPSIADLRLGEVGHLLMADAPADVILYNCVINLSLDKGAPAARHFPRPHASRLPY
jgi:hypothetical protein